MGRACGHSPLAQRRSDAVSFMAGQCAKPGGSWQRASRFPPGARCHGPRLAHRPGAVRTDSDSTLARISARRCARGALLANCCVLAPPPGPRWRHFVGWANEGDGPVRGERPAPDALRAARAVAERGKLRGPTRNGGNRTRVASEAKVRALDAAMRGKSHAPRVSLRRVCVFPRCDGGARLLGGRQNARTVAARMNSVVAP